MEEEFTIYDLSRVYKAILDSTQEIQKYLRYHAGKSKISNFIKIN